MSRKKEDKKGIYKTPIPYPHNKTFNCKIFIGVIKIYEYQY